MTADPERLHAFAERYAAAWCSVDPVAVAAHYAPEGSLVEGERVEYHWKFTGTNTGPGGTGDAVRVKGFESWTLDEDGLLAASMGSYDAEEYARQLAEGA